MQIDPKRRENSKKVQSQKKPEKAKPAPPKVFTPEEMKSAFDKIYKTGLKELEKLNSPPPVGIQEIINRGKSRRENRIALEENKNRNITSPSNVEEVSGAEKTDSGDLVYEDMGNEVYKYDDIRERFHLKKNPEHIDGDKYEVSGQIGNRIKKDETLSTAFIPQEESVTSSTGIIGSETPIKYLIQDNHPEKILGDGIGTIGKHSVSSVSDGEHNLLTSYHENRIPEQSGGDNDRSVVYNFTARADDTKLTFHRANFEVNPSGANAGALAAGDDFKNGNLDELKNNAYIRDKDGNIIPLDAKEMEKLKKEGKIKEEGGTFQIMLNEGETFSFQPSKKDSKTETLSPISIEKEHDVFASMIEFTNSEDMDITINSINKTSQDPTVKGSTADYEWFTSEEKGLKDEKGYYKFTDKKIDNLEKKLTNEFGKIFEESGKKESLHKLKEILKGLKDKVFPESEKEEELENLKTKFTDLKFSSEEADYILRHFLVTNYDEKGNAKQASGVFKNPNYDIKGTITPGNKENNYETPVIVFPPPEITKNESNVSFSGNPPVSINTEKYYSEGENEKGTVINDGAFSQNFHYKLKIENYEANPVKYEVLVIPGGDVFTVPGQSKPQMVKPNDLKKTAISLPCKVVEEEGEYYIEFDYFVTGGSGNPAYGKVLEKEQER